jgi:hypothetical protein
MIHAFSLVLTLYKYKNSQKHFDVAQIYIYIYFFFLIFIDRWAVVDVGKKNVYVKCWNIL